MAKYEGKCPLCGKIHYSDRKNDTIICDCWQHCPICGNIMTPHKPDLAPTTYGIDGKKELTLLMVCTSHSPPFFATQKPVEVVCT